MNNKISALTEESFRQELNTVGEVQNWHNPGDVTRYQNFLKKQKQRVLEYQKEENKKLVKENVQLWRSNLPTAWKHVRSRNLPRHVLTSLKNINTQHNNTPFSAYFTGDLAKKVMFAQYGTIDAFMAKGWTKPSATLVIDESTIVDMASSGFRGQEKFDNLNLGTKKLIAITNLGDYGTYDDKTSKMVESIIKQCFEHDITLFLGSSITLDEWAQFITSPGVRKKAKEIIANNIVDCNEPKSGYNASSINDFGRL